MGRESIILFMIIKYVSWAESYYTPKKLVSSTFIIHNLILLYKCKLYSRVCYFKKESNTTLMAESKEELKNLLMGLKEESEKAGLKKLRSWHLAPSLLGK